MFLSELEDHVSIILNQLMVKYLKHVLIKGVSVQFNIQDFGLVISCMDRTDYAQVSTKIQENYKDWRVIYITTNDNLIESKFKILWALMRGGYMKWLRYTYPRQVKNVLNGPENLGRRIIEERVRIWGGKQKYIYLINDNIVALKNGVLQELNSDPSFFDYMPEEE